MKDEINDYPEDQDRCEVEVCKAEYDFDELESALRSLEADIYEESLYSEDQLKLINDPSYPKWLDERQKEDLEYQMEQESRQYAEDAAADHLA